MSDMTMHGHDGAERAGEATGAARLRCSCGSW
jgi:hypothetical protein